LNFVFRFSPPFFFPQQSGDSMSTHRWTPRAFFIAMLFTLGATESAVAQPEDAPAPNGRMLCWRARPEPRCRSYLVTELGFELIARSTSVLRSSGSSAVRSDDFDARFSGTLGGMANRGPDNALGLVVAIMTDYRAPAFRLESRYRRWLGPTKGLDLAAGIVRKPLRDDTQGAIRHAVGLTAAIGVERGYFGADARVDWLRDNGRPVVGGFVGLRAGSRAAPVATAAVTLAILALLTSDGFLTIGLAPSR
jgi:hypothetical protein